jgi:pimeloyl-ACP methyl ester carboxylesterase
LVSPLMNGKTTATIVMIHGMCCGGWFWENFRDFFMQAGYRCLAPTLRYHDVDPAAGPHPHVGTVSLLDYAEDLENQIRQLETRPIIMGHSMGGLLAQILGSRGLGRALVLLTPAPPAGITVLKPSVLRGFQSGLTRWGFWRKPFRQTFAEAEYSVLNRMPAERRLEVFSRFVYDSGRAACEIGFWFFDAKKAARVDGGVVRCPVLVVAGAQDRMTPASICRQVAAKYAAVATYKEFGDHSHWVTAEPGWHDIAQYVADWLGQTIPQATVAIS